MTVVFYRPEMSVRTSSFSPSADKPRKVVQDWLTHRRTAHCRPEIRAFEAASSQELSLVHAEQYVLDVLAGERNNGFGNASLDVAAACRYTCGSMVAAALYSLQERRNSCSPTSGFHHAGYGFGGGFCTFNGLVLAALMAIRAGAAKVIILDLDYHDGNGTRDIIDRLRLAAKVEHRSGGEHRLRDKAAVYDFIRSSLRKGADLLLYQAGADMHEDDPLGGVRGMNTREMMRRDDCVFTTACRLRLPVAWNLAGGYQQSARGSIRPLLTIHRNTYLCSLQDGAHDAPVNMGGEDEQGGG